MRSTSNGTQGASAWISLGLIGLVLVYNGTLDVPDIDRGDQILVICLCLAGGITSLLLSFLAFTGRTSSPAALEASIATGLISGIIVNSVTGAVWPGTLWITCGYTVVLTFTSAVTLRSRYVFGPILVVLLVAWLLSVEFSDQHLVFGNDANTLVIVSGGLAVATFALLRRERATQAGLTEQLREQLDYDSLTGALNRTGLLSRINGMNVADSYWCAYVDVDFFKSINDRMGHDYGDVVLKGIASGLREVLGEETLVARWGGDEFVVVGAGTAPTEAFIEDEVHESLTGKDLVATMTVGITSSPEIDHKRSEGIIGRADRRMYERRDALRAQPDT